MHLARPAKTRAGRFRFPGPRYMPSIPPITAATPPEDNHGPKRIRHRRRADACLRHRGQHPADGGLSPPYPRPLSLGADGPVPELSAKGPNRALAEPLPGPAEEALAALVRETGLSRIPGSLFERTPQGIFNTTPVIAPDGSVIARFRKLFPFRPYEQCVEAGAEFVTFDVPEVGRFGVSICYDM